MNDCTVALFGEAEKGEYKKGYFCRTLEELEYSFGNPPEESRGLYYAVQALLHRYSLVFFRVREEGFSHDDYLFGLSVLKREADALHLSAICLPGLGDRDIIRSVVPLCLSSHSILIISETDLYDYLMQ